MLYSYSNVDTYNQCSFRWYLRYIKKIRFEPTLEPDSPLLIGTLLHDSIEFGIDKAEQMYYDKYPIIQNEHIDEVIKVSHFYDDIINILPSGINEYKISTDDFLGYIDLVSKNEDGTYTVWDFKYSNNINIYKKKMQLHIYKYYLEKTTDFKVTKLKYLFVPKTKLKRGFDQDIRDFRKELMVELETMKIKVIEIEFDESQVEKYFNIIEEIESDDVKLTKNVGPLCYWCDYENICINSKIKA